MKRQPYSEMVLTLLPMPKPVLLTPPPVKVPVLAAPRVKPVQASLPAGNSLQTTPAAFALLPDSTANEQTASAYQIIEQAKRDILRIDRETRGVVNAVPGESRNSQRNRLIQGIESAFIGDTAEVTDHYTAADGVVYTRFTRGTRSRCYMSGAGNYVSQAATGAGWRPVNCPPSNSGWVR